MHATDLIPHIAWVASGAGLAWLFYHLVDWWLRGNQSQRLRNDVLEANAAVARRTAEAGRHHDQIAALLTDLETNKLSYGQLQTAMAAKESSLSGNAAMIAKLQTDLAAANAKSADLEKTRTSLTAATAANNAQSSEISSSNPMSRQPMPNRQIRTKSEENATKPASRSQRRPRTSRA
jgi:uncharacterized membrane-anchored protein YhcB (DUF1043 family)